ncbi:hypothetical protein P4534_23920 [Peribacillus butanolivorans]|uniref:hypothetical protein n=1 Tax=Peribacillus butanolivorans TaxID=421767 RepID=UPI002E1C2625|nr:hypothetical protein [Peribacillus butanolivorans]
MKCHPLNATGMIVVGPFISRKLPLEEILKDFGLMKIPDVSLKILFGRIKRKR